MALSLEEVEGDHDGTLGDYGLAIAISFVTLGLSCFVVERPIQRFGSRLRAAPARERAEPVPSPPRLH